MQLLPEASISAAPAAASALECAEAMLDGLPQVMWFIRRQMRRHRSHGLSVPQFRTLCLLDRYPDASVSMVAENLGASLPTASRLVTGLVTRGFVARKEHPTDRRQVSLALTARGRQVQNSARRATEQSVAREISHLSDAQRVTVVGAMRLLSEVFAATPPPDGQEITEDDGSE
jgi:DNA-binding MarR family transcriptional regulator